jgi:hypothetical protein
LLDPTGKLTLTVFQRLKAILDGRLMH